MFKFSWEMPFFEMGDTEVLKGARNNLIASNKQQIDNQTLVLNMLHSYMSVVYIYHCRGVFKKTVWYGLSLTPKKPLKAMNFKFNMHKAPSKVKE